MKLESCDDLKRDNELNIINRAKLAYYTLANKNLGNSLGTVLRNFTDESSLQPKKQFKGITYKAIDKIGMAVSVYEPIVVKASGDAIENHPIKNLIKKPNNRQFGADFAHMWAMYMMVYGESFFYIVKGDMTQKVKEVYMLNPEQMEVVVSNEGDVVGYKLHKSNGNQVPFEVEEIVHDKLPNIFNEYRGLSVLERAAIYVDTEITTSQFTLNYMRNNASPSGIVTVNRMESNAFKQFAEQWREKYEGPENAGKTAFIRGAETNFQAVGATLRDVDQKVTREMAKDDVLMMFDVPKGLLGTSGEKGLGRNELEPLEYIFAKYKTDPLMERYDDIWEQIAEKGRLKDTFTEIEHVSPIPDDKNYKLERHKYGVNKWITVNEAREADGLPPIDGGDELQTNNPVDLQVKSALKKKLVVIKKDMTEVEKTKKLNDEQEAFRSKLIANGEIYGKKLKAKISNFAANQEEEIISKINVSSKAYEEWLFNVKEQSEELAAILTPIVLELMQSSAEIVATEVTGQLLEISPEIENRVALQMKEIAGVYNTETIQKLEKTITQGASQGESLTKIKKRVESVYEEAKGYRAERIARTESLRQTNETAELSYRQSGYSKVSWIVNPGACDFCLTLSGRTREIGGKYIGVGGVVTTAAGDQMRIEYRDINVPPLHPNCNCSLIPEV